MLKRNTFPTKYDPKDIALLAETDNVHNRLSGRATKEIFQRQYNKFGNNNFKKLSKISVSHIYNLREKNQYKSKCLIYSKTQAIQVAIGERKKPNPKGKPGYIRVDSVHQGDKNKDKGVCHIMPLFKFITTKSLIRSSIRIMYLRDY
ncbi:MAG: hypothetical protein GF335_00660 [Candidatus Moranbacteria bacterium]|nr:hypothetical protein [Candidatus Moranbacteria bacterium]